MGYKLGLMNGRPYGQWAITAFCGALFFFGYPAIAQEEEDLPYRELSVTQAVESGDKIEVREFFWYGCPHCYTFEPYLKKWLQEKADYIEFVRTPAILNRDWLPHAKAFYAAEELGVLEKIHLALFDAIHGDKKHLLDEKSLTKFFAKQGVDKGEFKAAYRSKAVEEKVKGAFSAGKNFQLRGVPAVAINGKYMTGPREAGSFSAMLDTVNDLAEQEHALTQDE